MKRMRLMAVAALAASTFAMTAVPAQAQTQARCLPEYAIVCQVIVLVCRLSGRPCAA
jgi:hypothetical protein